MASMSTSGDESIANGSAAEDSWHQVQGGFRMDSVLSPQDNLSVHGDIRDGRENEEADNTARTGGGNIVGQWTHQSDSGSQISLQSYYDRTHLADPVARDHPRQYSARARGLPEG